MHTTITIGIKHIYIRGEPIVGPATPLEPLVIHRPAGITWTEACDAARAEFTDAARQLFGEEVARLAQRTGQFASMTSISDRHLYWTVHATNGDVLGALEGRIATTDVGTYRLEIRFDFAGTQHEAEVEAQRLANQHGGTVTAIFDVNDDYEEV